MAQSQNQEKKAWYNAFNKLRHGIMTNIECAFVAKVVKYNSSDHTADILPLVESSDGEVSAQYLDVPVSESCYILDEVLDQLKPEMSKVDSHVGSDLVGKLPPKHFMRAGVPVIAVVPDRDMDNWKGGKSTDNFMPNSSRTHDANDAVIVGVLGGDAANG